jgi:hypothetical protein
MESRLILLRSFLRLHHHPHRLTLSLCHPLQRDADLAFLVSKSKHDAEIVEKTRVASPTDC